MTDKNFSLFATIITTLVLAANATPAFAAWETITDSPRETNNNCKDEHTDMSGRLRNDGTRIRVRSG